MPAMSVMSRTTSLYHNQLSNFLSYFESEVSLLRMIQSHKTFSLLSSLVKRQSLLVDSTVQSRLSCICSTCCHDSLVQVYFNINKVLFDAPTSSSFPAVEALVTSTYSRQEMFRDHVISDVSWPWQSAQNRLAYVTLFWALVTGMTRSKSPRGRDHTVHLALTSMTS